MSGKPRVQLLDADPDAHSRSRAVESSALKMGVGTEVWFAPAVRRTLVVVAAVLIVLIVLANRARALQIEKHETAVATFLPIPGGPLASRQSVSNVNNELHVVALSAIDSSAYHAIRYANGSWSGFGPIGGPYVDVATASVAGELQVMTQSADNTLFHGIRHSDGSWTGIGNVNGAVQNSGGPIDGLTATGGAWIF
jgi:hypothetical protein